MIEMLKADWEELEAQVETHGPNVVEFFLENPTDLPDEYLGLDIKSIQYVDGKIRVVFVL